jgi:hypothetical protein
MLGLLTVAAARLASAVSPSPGATPRYEDDAIVRPGFLGFGIFLALVAASYFLFRSMNRQLKKVDFEEAPPADQPPRPPEPPS